VEPGRPSAFFYSSGKMMAANLKAATATLEVTSVTPLFDCRPPEGFRRMFYDVMPDRQSSQHGCCLLSIRRVVQVD